MQSKTPTGQHNITDSEQQSGVLYCEILHEERTRSVDGLAQKAQQYSLTSIRKTRLDVSAEVFEGTAVAKAEYRFPLQTRVELCVGVNEEKSCRLLLVTPLLVSAPSLNQEARLRDMSLNCARARQPTRLHRRAKIEIVRPSVSLSVSPLFAFPHCAQPPFSSPHLSVVLQSRPDMQTSGDPASRGRKRS